MQTIRLPHAGRQGRRSPTRRDRAALEPLEGRRLLSAAPAAPVVVSPGSTASPGPVLTTATPTYAWKAEAAATFTSYQLNVLDVTSGKLAIYPVSKTATSYTPATPLTAGDDYKWDLGALNGKVYSPASALLYFQGPLPAPVVTSPGTTASPGPVLATATPTFSWRPVTGVAFTAYQLNLDDLTAGKFVSYTIAPTYTTFALPTALTAGDDYVWNLRLDNGTASGPPSTYLYFAAPAAVALPAPTVLTPGSTTAPGPVLTTASPTFTWHAVTNATFTAYQINLENLTTNTFTSYQVGKTATQIVVPTPLPAGDRFVWNLRLDNGTASGPPSTYLYFQTPAAAALPAPTVIGPGTTASPGPLLTTTTPTFTWHAVTGVGFTAYQLNLDDVTSGAFVSYTIAPPTTQFTPATPLVPGDRYVWNLRFDNGTASGPPSAYLYFQVPAATPLPAPVVIGPGTTASPGPLLTTTTPTFTWHAVTGVTFDNYQLNLYDQTLGKFLEFQIAPNATSFTPPAGDLAAGDTFVWNLRLRVGDTTGPESVYLYFRT